MIPEESFSSCVHELNICFWHTIKSYKLICLWHEQHPASTESKMNSSSSSSSIFYFQAAKNNSSEPSQDFLIQKLENGSNRLWHEIQQKVKILILETNMINFKFEEFIRILKVINR